jgi:hypothetical protein
MERRLQQIEGALEGESMPEDEIPEEGGYTKGEFDESAKSPLKRPNIMDIILMEEKLGIPHIETIKIAKRDDAWEYYHYLKYKIYKMEAQGVFDECDKSPKRPDITDIILMEMELDLPHVDQAKIDSVDKIWRYYRELKSKLDERKHGGAEDRERG